MPRRKSEATVVEMPRRRPAYSAPENPLDSLHLGNKLATAIIGLLCTLIATGVTGMVVLYKDVATLTEAQMRTQKQLDRHLDHSVDRDAWIDKDSAIQKELGQKASKEEVGEIRDQLKEQLRELRTAQELILSARIVGPAKR